MGESGGPHRECDVRVKTCRNGEEATKLSGERLP